MIPFLKYDTTNTDYFLSIFFNFVSKITRRRDDGRIENSKS